jgi:hypothetical protein
MDSYGVKLKIYDVSAYWKHLNVASFQLRSRGVPSMISIVVSIKEKTISILRYLERVFQFEYNRRMGRILIKSYLMFPLHL